MNDKIQQIDGHADLTDAEISTAFAVLVLKPESSFTYNQVVTELGDVVIVETMISAMRSSSLNASADSFISRGIDFGISQTQEMIDMLAGSLPLVFTAEATATLKGLGQQTKWASLGGTGDPPDATAIATERARHAASLLLDAVRTRSEAAYEAAAVEYRAGRFDTITSAAETSWGGV